MSAQTKSQHRREAAYRRQLKRCGFRSWKRANDRRSDLIGKVVYGSATSEDSAELDQLQRLADLYLKWKTNDLIGRENRRLERLQRRLEREHGITL